MQINSTIPSGGALAAGRRPSGNIGDIAAGALHRQSRSTGSGMKGCMCTSQISSRGITDTVCRENNLRRTSVGRWTDGGDSRCSLQTLKYIVKSSCVEHKTMPFNSTMPVALAYGSKHADPSMQPTPTIVQIDGKQDASTCNLAIPTRVRYTQFW